MQNENNAFNNANTVYIGTTLRLNSKLNIQSTGLLGGNGILRRRDDLGAGSGPLPVDVEVFTGGQISPGDYALVDTTDIFTINGNLHFSGGTLAIDITGTGGVAGVDLDQVVVTDSTTPSGRGNVTGLTSATLVVDFHNLSLEDVLGETFDILTSLNDLSGNTFAEVIALNRGGNYKFDVLFGNGLIQLANFVEIVPEPSTFALLSIGLVSLVARTRRRSQGRA